MYVHTYVSMYILYAVTIMLVGYMIYQFVSSRKSLETVVFRKIRYTALLTKDGRLVRKLYRTTQLKK